MLGGNPLACQGGHRMADIGEFETGIGEKAVDLKYDFSEPIGQ
jgi:hypothetical protein